MGSPIISKTGSKESVVCAGTGNNLIWNYTKLENSMSLLPFLRLLNATSDFLLAVCYSA